MSTTMDIRLKAVQPKAIWGCRSMPDKKSIIAIADYEYAVAVGTGIMLFDNNTHGLRKTYLVNSHNTDVLFVTQMVLSFDGKYLVNVVKMKNEDDHSVNILIYTVDYLRVEYRAPRLVTYRNPAYVVGGEKIELNCVAFSHDSQYIALGTNIPSIGIVILDHKKGEVFQVIPTNSPPSHITFNPMDPCKLCVTGNAGLFQFWRFTQKSVHLAPVVGLRGHSLNYTNHVWIPPYADGLVIASTSSGLLSLVLGGEQKGHNVHVFGAQSHAPKDKDHGEHRPDDHSILQILVRGDVILALSPYNEVVAFEVRRVLQSKGINTLSPTLGLLKRYRLSNIDELLGIDWCIRDSVTSFAVVGMSRNSVFQVEVIGDIDMEVSGGINAAADATKDHSAEWVQIANEQYIFRYHGAEVHSMSLSGRTNTLVTSSYTDATVRVWNFNAPSSYRGTWLVESFAERPQENPFHVDMHPTGALAICALEGEVREYAITDEHLELYRRVNIKGPFTGPTGTAHVISQPVSIVRYSNSGQYFVVVTGKLAQVFGANVNEFSQSGGVGFPSRVMVLCDHIAPITDVDFSRDDSRIITTSSDGCIYYWKVGALTRDQEYVFKGMSVNKVALSKSKAKETHIIAVCEGHNEFQNQHQGPAEAMMLRRQSTVLMRRSTRHGEGGGAPLDAHSSFMGTANIAESLLAGDGHASRTAASNRQQPASVQAVRKTFLAIWKDAVTPAPRILALDSEVRCIALGDTDGPDKYDICVLGLADGRVLVSLLPLPSHFHRSLDVQLGASISAPVSITPTGAGQTLKMAPRGRQKGFLATDGPHEKSTRKFGGLTTQLENQQGPSDGASTADGDSTSGAMSMHLKDRDDLSVYSRQSSVLDGSDVSLGINGIATATVGPSTSAPQEFLDEARCRQMRMHCGPVSLVAVTRNGMFIFSAGMDGVVHMYATSKRGLEMIEMPQPSENMENRFHLVEASKLRALRHQLSDTERMIETNKKDYDLKVDKILESKEKMVNDLKAKMQKEIRQRDETILNSRNEYLKLKTSMNGEISGIRKQCNDSISELELAYEQKLSQESLYLDKMKQAYDEYVVHSRMDLSELQRRTDQRVEGIQADRNSALLEAEKQKKTVLQYFEYVKLRNDELMQSLEQNQVEERCKLKEELTMTAKQLEKAQGHLLTGEVQANREVSKLQLLLEEKDNDVLKLRSSVDWSQNRILELEQALHKATAELGVRTEMSEKWELKTGEMQQKIIELEKLRKALTTQLHTLRQELGPKEETLMRVTEKLQETDREYELSLQAIAEKEKNLGQKSESLNLLQKQVRDLRGATSRKEKVLRRAAILLDEYKFALEQAYFKAEKRTVGGADKMLQDALGAAAGGTGTAADAAAVAASRRRSSAHSLLGATGAPKDEVVEIISQNDGMKSSLKRLSDILTPFLNEENNDAEMMEEQEHVRQEQDRHMYLLHRNVNGLRANLDLAQTVAATKVQNHLSDNQNLLKEVNNLRFEVRNLSMENQRLIAQLEFNNRMQGGRRRGNDNDSPTGERDDDLIFPQYHQQAQANVSHEGSAARAQQHQKPLRGAGNGGGGDGLAASIDSGTVGSAPEGVSFDSNGLRSDADFFNTMRGAAPRAPKGGVVPNKKVSKSASAPFFSIKAVHSDPVADGARNALSATVAGSNTSFEERKMQQDSVASKRTITGVPSYLSLQASQTSQEGGGSGVISKNEYMRSADEKIAALMELNEQQIRALKEEQIAKTAGGSAPAKASASTSGAGKGNKATKAIHVASVSQELSYMKGDTSLELLGAPAVLDAPLRNLSLASDGSSGFQLPNIRKNSGSNSSTNRKK